MARKRDSEMLTEYSGNSGNTLTVDRDSRVIRGVKILGLESKNGRNYSPAAIARAIQLYEGAKVNVDHPEGKPNSPRKYSDRFGSVREVEQRPDGLYGNLHYNPKHWLAEQLLDDAEHAPENVGLSHNIEGKVVNRNGKAIVEEIVKVTSVDLVADPATNKSLFESIEEIDSVDYSKLTYAELAEHRNDLIQEALNAASETEAAKARDAEFKAIKEELDALKAEKNLAEQKASIIRAAKDAKIPDDKITEAWIKSVLPFADDATALKEQIEDRKSLVVVSGAQKPVSRDLPTITESVNKVTCGKDFAKAICQ